MWRRASRSVLAQGRPSLLDAEAVLFLRTACLERHADNNTMLEAEFCSMLRTQIELTRTRRGQSAARGAAPARAQARLQPGTTARAARVKVRVRRQRPVAAAATIKKILSEFVGVKLVKGQHLSSARRRAGEHVWNASSNAATLEAALATAAPTAPLECMQPRPEFFANMDPVVGYSADSAPENASRMLQPRGTAPAKNKLRDDRQGKASATSGNVLGGDSFGIRFKLLHGLTLNGVSTPLVMVFEDASMAKEEFRFLKVPGLGVDHRDDGYVLLVRNRNAMTKAAWVWYFKLTLEYLVVLRLRALGKDALTPEELKNNGIVVTIDGEATGLAAVDSQEIRDFCKEHNIQVRARGQRAARSAARSARVCGVCVCVWCVCVCVCVCRLSRPVRPARHGSSCATSLRGTWWCTCG